MNDDAATLPVYRLPLIRFLMRKLFIVKIIYPTDPWVPEEVRAKNYHKSAYYKSDFVSRQSASRAKPPAE
jgi:hypothetical protein